MTDKYMTVGDIIDRLNKYGRDSKIQLSNYYSINELRLEVCGETILKAPYEPIFINSFSIGDIS